MKKAHSLLKTLALLTLTIFLFSPSVPNVQAQSQSSYLIVHALNPEGVEIASILGISEDSVRIYDGTSFLGYSAYNQETHSQPIAIAPGNHLIKAVFNGITLVKNVSVGPGQTKEIAFVFNRTLFDLSPYIYESNLSAAFQGTYSGITPRVEDWDWHPITDWWVGGYFEEFVANGSGAYSAEAKLQFYLSGTNYDWYNYAFYHLSSIHGRDPGYGGFTIETFTDSGNYPIPSQNLGFSNWYVQYNQAGDVEFLLDNQQLSGIGMLLLNSDRDSTLRVILGNPLHVWGANTYNYDEGDYYHLVGEFEETGSGTLDVKMSSVPYDIFGTGIKDEIPDTPLTPLDKETPQDKTTTVGEPINVANGNMFTTDNDISIPSSLIPLEFSRTYNSQDDFQGSFGYGWRSNFDITLSEQPDSSVIEVDETGVYTIYSKNPDNSYSASAGKYSILTKNPDNTYQILRKHGAKLYFNAQGLLTRIEDRNANAITILRDASGVIQEVSDSSGRKLLFSADSQGKITQVTDPKGRIFKYEYDANGNLIKTTGPLDNKTTYLYDSNHNLTQLTDPNSHSLYFEYDSNDKAFHSWQENNNNEVTLVFNPANKTTTSTDSLGNVTTYEYNDYGLVTKITDSQGNTQAFIWDANLNKTSSINQNGSTTSFAYDARGNLLTITDALYNTTTFTYEPNFDFIASTTDALGNTTTYSYDAKGNLIQTKDALNNITAYSYNLLGQLLLAKDANNNITTFSYDIYGNLTQATDSLNNPTSFAYDILGNKTQAADAQGNVTGYTYDSLNRLTQITYPDNSKVTYTYDAVGNPISSIDQNNNTTNYAYDVADRLIQVTDAQGNATAYTYDTEGNRTQIIDANGNTTQYSYDNLRRLIKTQDVLGNQTLFSYDPKGNLISKTDPNGNVIYYTYDALNRLIEKGLSPQGSVPESVVSYSYDALGNMLSAANFNISYKFAYDSLGELLSVIDSNNRSISYAYDAVGNKTRMTTPEAKTVSYSYDSLNRLVSILDTYNKTTSYSYDSLSRRIKVTLPNQTQASYSYDSLNNLSSLVNKTKNDEVISNYAYTYDKAGNRLTKTEPSLKTSYTYDTLYRLTQSTPVKIKNNGEEKEKKNQLETFTYDALGNRLTSAKDAYSYNSLYQLLNTNGYSYEYDKNGNLIKKTETDETDSKQKAYTFTYDYENRLIRVEIQKEDKLKAVTFTYDPFGRRFSKTVQKEEIEDEDNGDNDEEDNDDKIAPRTTYYVYDSEDIILEYNQKGKITARYTHGPGIDEPISIERNNKLYYYHYDGLGSVTSLTNQKGKTAESYAYDSFGNLKRQGNKTKNTFTYTAREFDKETGLYYYRARYYDPKIGRFLTQDPIGMVDGPNLYSYVGNNAVNFVDPWGLTKNKPWWQKLKEGYYFGTGFGQQSAEWYAQQQLQTGNPLWAIPGSIASLWTPETYQMTGWTLVGAAAYPSAIAMARTTGPAISSAVIKAKVATGALLRRTLLNPVFTKHILPPLIAAWMRWAAMESSPSPVFWESAKTSITELIKR